MKEPAKPRAPEGGAPPDLEDARLLGQIRHGDADAGQQFVQKHYPGIYRYLLSLTGRVERAEDLAQETFLQAWRHLDRFEGRAPLRVWLYKIARREFLQALRRAKEAHSLEEVGELPEPRAQASFDAVELRAILAGLPLEQREMMALHYVHGYDTAQVARIVGASVGRVKFRLVEARAHLRSLLGEGEMSYLNEPATAAARRWVWLPLTEMAALEARLPVAGASSRDGAVGGDVPAQPASGPRATPVGAPDEEEITDSRLTRKVSLAVKAIALGDLCAHLSAETGLKVTAGPSVADEKVTLFCKDTPLREVMRQLSRPFGYTWVRSGGLPIPSKPGGAREGGYRYELAQELRAQLLEEELRNRDRNTALIVLEREIGRFRLYLDLSPDEALARSRTAPPEEKRLLEKLGGAGWGAVQMYFRLTPQQQAALRAGQQLHFTQSPKPGELTLPPEIARGVLQSLRTVFYHRSPDGFGLSTGVTEPAIDDIRPSALPEARAAIDLSICQNELGQVALRYVANTFSESNLPRNSGGGTFDGDGSIAVGASPTVVKPDNRAANARLSGVPVLKGRVSLEIQPSCGGDLSPGPSPRRGGEAGARGPAAAAVSGSASGPPSPSRRGAGGEVRATSADLLEAVHRATGLPVVGDFYTRLYDPGALASHEQPLFDVLCRLCDEMHLRWSKDGDWHQFRSASFYDDRLKEVPNRLLSRWTASRKQHGALMLDDLVEIASLADVQLDGEGMAEGARLCWGLEEWRLPRTGHLRDHLRFLAEMTPAQRQEVMSPTGLPFTKLTLAQQQRYIALALRFDDTPLQSLDELEGAVVRVDYLQPGGFEWVPPGPNWYQFVVPIVPGQEGRRAILPAVRGRTRVEALAAARRLEPRLLDAILPEAHRLRPEVQAAAQIPDAGEVVPTQLNIRFVYIPGLSNRRNISLAMVGADFHNSSW